jgi:hypothetical protein
MSVRAIPLTQRRRLVTRPRAKNRTTVEALQAKRATYLAYQKRAMQRAKRYVELSNGLEPEMKKYSHILKETLPLVLSDLWPNGRIDMKLKDVLSVVRTHPDLPHIRPTDLRAVLDNLYVKNSEAGWESKIVRAKITPTVSGVKKVKAIQERDFHKDMIYPDFHNCNVFNRTLGKDANRGDSREKVFTVIGYPDTGARLIIGGRYVYEYDKYKVVFNDQHRLVDVQIVK